jgi:hypothetical protein
MPAYADGPRKFDLQVSGSIAEVPLTLKRERESHMIELRNIDGGARPILQILGARGSETPGVQSIAGSLAVSLPANTAGSFTLIIRSQTAGVFQADVWVDGKVAAKAVSFGQGTVVRLPNFAAGEQVVAVSPPGGLGSHTAYLMSADGSRILARVSGASTTLAARWSGDAIIVYGTASGVRSGRLLVYRNDRATDADGDGLGDRLEAQIGTCGSRTSRVNGTDCGSISDATDTDGDGLWDSWELFGKYQWVQGSLEFVPLPTWGANPRHKDIFIEVDFRRLNSQENQMGLAAHMSPAVARQMAAIYADQATTDPSVRAAHALDVGNPDGEPGISLHLDTGVAPQIAADATIYGDWGGYTAVDAIPDGLGGYRPLTPEEARVGNLLESRRGLFHYVFGYTSGGGACRVGIACGFDMAEAGNSAHEFGHTLYLNHNGPEGTHEPNCKPNYPSLMNYAYYDKHFNTFSDGRGFLTLNNHALVESGVVANQPAVLNILRTVFGYRVDPTTGSVDWNRDGVFQPASTLVRAYANLQPGNSGGCEFTREGEVPVGTTSQRSPAVVRYNGLIWVFTVTLDHKLQYSYTASPWTCQNIDDCPTPAFPNHFVRDIGPVDGIDAAAINVNGNWVIIIVGIRPDGTLFETWMHMSDWQVILEGDVTVPASRAAGEPSLAVSRDGRSVALAYKGTDNIVRYRTRTTSAWRPEEVLTVGGQPLKIHPTASPSLAFTGLSTGIIAGQESIVGAVADPNGIIQLYTRSGFPQRWMRLPIPYDYMYSPIGRPAMAWTGTAPTNTTGTGLAAGSSTVGRFYILYLMSRTPGEDAISENPVRMAMSYVDANGTLRIGLDSYFDNYWSFAFGIDLLQPGEVGLRSAEVYSIPNAPAHPDTFHLVTFRPHADGISNLPYSDKNDWMVLGWASCRVLADSQSLSMKTSCPPKPW